MMFAGNNQALRMPECLFSGPLPLIFKSQDHGSDSHVEVKRSLSVNVDISHVLLPGNKRVPLLCVCPVLSISHTKPNVGSRSEAIGHEWPILPLANRHRGGRLFCDEERARLGGRFLAVPRLHDWVGGKVSTVRKRAAARVHILRVWLVFDTHTHLIGLRLTFGHPNNKLI